MNMKSALLTAIVSLAACVASAQPTPPGAEGPDDEMALDGGGPRAPGGGGRMGPDGRMGQNGPMGMRGPRRGAGGPGEQEPALTEAQEQELLGFLKENAPKLYANLNAAKGDNPQMQKHRLSGLWKLYKNPEARENFVKHAKANEAVRDLAVQYKKAGEKEKAAVKEKLGKAVGELFDADLGSKELQIKRMQDDIAKFKEKIAKRRQLKDKIVARRVEQLTGEGDDWE